MARFSYIAKNNKGKTIKGIIEASSHSDIVAILKGRNYYPIEIKPIGQALDLTKYKKIKVKDLAVFCRQFATTLRSGIPVVDSLEILHKQTENKKFAQVIGDVYEIIQKGHSLSEAMGAHPNVFPMLLINMVETGEISGTLDSIMERMAVHFEKENRINQKLKSSMTYPIVVSIVAVLVVIFLLTFVMPTFIGMFDSMGAELPLLTRILMGISYGLRKFWYIYLLVVVLIIYGFNKYYKTPSGKYKIDKLKLGVPIFGKVQKKVVVSRFTRTLSTLLNSGIDLLQALDAVQRVINNDFVNEKMRVVEEEARKGLGLSQPIMRTGIFPPMVHQMVKVGEDTGSLDSILEKTADFYDEEVETALSQMTTMIEPLIIVVLGGMVGFIVAAMILPMFDMYNIIG